MTRRYFLHLGAHRTGSSSFQLALHRNRHLLAEAGYTIGFPSRDGVRAGLLAIRLPAPRHEGDKLVEFEDKLRAHLDNEIVPDPDARVILSEENILGSMAHFERAMFYPAAAKRLGVLRRGLGAAPEHVLITVRSYAHFFLSAYRKRAEEAEVAPFDQVVPYFLGMDRGWPEVIADLCAELQPRRVTVLRHEERVSRRRMLALLAEDVSEGDLLEPQRSLNLSATDRALEVLQKMHAAGRVTRKERRQVIEDHKLDQTPLGFAQYDPLALKAMEIRYARDLERLGEMTGVTLL